MIAKILMVMAFNRASLGDSAEGQRLLDFADILAFADDRGILLHQRALILWQSGRLSDALHWFELAEPLLAEYGPDNFYAASFYNRALVWRDLGELRKGMESIRRAIELYNDIDVPVNRARAIHIEALLLLDLGEVTKALKAFDVARDQFRKLAPDLESFIDASYAHALLSVGMYRQAAERWEHAIAAHRLAGDLRNAAIDEYWRALAAFEDNRSELADRWARQAMDSLYSQGNEPMAFLARLLILQAQFDSGQHGPDFADKVQRLCDALEQRGWTLRLKQAKILAARAKIKAGEFDGVEQVLQGEHGGPGHDALAEELARYLAKAELAVAQDRDPLPELLAGLDLLDEYRMAFGSVEFQAGASALGIQLAFMGLGHVARHSGPEDMLWWVERSRAQALRIPPVKPSTDPAAREALGQLRQARQRLWDLQVEGGDDAEARSRVQEIEEEIRAHERAQPGSGKRADRIAPDAIQDLAESRDTVVVNMFEVANKVCAVLAGGDGLQFTWMMPLDEATELERRLGADLDALGSRRRLHPRIQASVEGAIRRNATALADGIWKPIADYVGDRQVVIVPHSQLNWVPWPLLPPLRGRAVTISPSAEAWWRAVHRTRADGPALVAAGPALSLAGGEIETIAGLYPGANLITADESDPEMVLKALDNAAVAHIAAHGHHEPDNVLFSRLDFGLGPLNAYELLGLDQPPGHVVLSSCDLGRSTVAVGNETLGFTAALLHAGTSTVVSSLAKVPDEMAAEMMIEYHKRCVAGASPAEALAAVGEHRPWHPFVAFGA
ncbi:CHAT domain-containing protein [Glycomyces niveus]|uniref:CHAT domain-containing protein n=1 Tax=Glycomyces niveus TaxID=2820287 RepID=A0ABS3U8C8_9ACTN|nr:CHAT domain-containing tetratricopeptide repeat protein [Glycomyces sp. NEAU-S30]MBO3734013.1 CHAT domain-containing protein [Glycomyces sp. NEAU-S30]